MQNASPKAKLDKLDDLLQRSSTPLEDAALIAEMLSIANDGRYPAVEMSPQQRRRKTLEALTAQLEALAHSSPVLMIFEDLQWIDPTSLEVLDRIVNRIKTLPVLLIVTARPDAEPRWVGRPHVTALTLNRLGKRETVAMINSVTGKRSLPGRIREDIVERTDGIPLFIEEMTKAALEASNDNAAEQTVAATPSPSVAVPLSLHAPLMARLHRLGPAKKVAQIAAVIGREFGHALLAAVAQKTEPELARYEPGLSQVGRGQMQWRANSSGWKTRFLYRCFRFRCGIPFDVHERACQRDLQLDLLAAQCRRGRQPLNLGKCPGELFDGFNERDAKIDRRIGRVQNSQC